MRKTTTFSRTGVLTGSALLLLACAGLGCSESKRELTLQMEYRLCPTDNPADALQGARAVVERRVAVLARGARVIAAEPDRILVQLRDQDAAALETLKSVIQNIGYLDFRVVASNRSRPYEDWQRTGKAPAGWTEYPLRSLKEERYVEEKVLVKDHCEMTGEHIASARVVTAGGGRSLGPQVGLSFTPRGERDFARVTGENVGERLAIILNTQRSGDQITEKGTCYSCNYHAPADTEWGSASVVIVGGFTIKEAEALCIVLGVGSLPAPLVFEKATPLSTNPPRDGAVKENK